MKRGEKEMTLKYVNDYINNKISQNENLIEVSFFEIRVKENLSEEDSKIFTYLSKQRLVNLGYYVYCTGDEYEIDGMKMHVKSNMLFIAIKSKK